jgi:acetylornithine deacetylase
VLDLTDLLADLVSIPSVNPMGRDLAGPHLFETRLTDYLEGFFRELDVPFERQWVSEGRENVVARVDSPGSPVTLLFEAHQDTVPAENMTIDPFSPLVKDGRLYGRGACDVKGGLAAMLGAFARVANERPGPAASVVMACTVDEEFTGSGALRLARLWTDGAGSEASLISRPPDFAIVAEPTELDIVVAHKGAIRWKIRTLGRACHSSRPEDGVNAIYKMAEVVASLADYAGQLPRRVEAHPLCGVATLSVGRIEGGVSTNVVPEECTIEIDRRLLPGENGQNARLDVEAFLRDRLGDDVGFEMLEPWTNSSALDDSSNGRLAELLGGAVDSVLGSHRKRGVTYGTDASKFSVTGVPCVVFGPGSIAQAHTCDEWISLDQLDRASEILFRLIQHAGKLQR